MHQGSTSLNRQNISETYAQLEPDAIQARASDPQTSAWANASAGTGKTKVLTDRVLRLLLPREDGSHGTPLHKILCLTFTKAAASEMALRIHHTLSQWCTMIDHELTAKLEKLLKRDVSNIDISAARKLFTQIGDNNYDLKIQTIHAFCQALLGRFPLEAGLSPNHEIIEEADAKILFEQAIIKTIASIKKEPGSQTYDALMHLSSSLNENALIDLIHNIYREHMQLDALKAHYFDLDGLHEHTCNLLNVDKHIDPDQIVYRACTDENFDKKGLFSLAQDMVQKGSKTDIERGQKILDFLSQPPKDRQQSFLESYKSAFISHSSSEPYKRLITNKIINLNPNYTALASQEAERILAVYEDIKKYSCALHTHYALLLSRRVIDAYKDIKTKRGVLDFEDLIFYTKKILSQPNTMNWIMYKLDQGIDHILVDEAQDTNPEQWDIINALCDDFFSGRTAHTEKSKSERTLFVVGDDKQSIYSFQRAAPQKFYDTHKIHKQRATDVEHKWTDVEMNISFRTNQTILDVVNTVFPNTNHRSYRTGQEGRVTLWPLSAPDELEPPNIWEGPLKIWEKRSASTVLAQNIAAQIRQLLENKVPLHSRGRRTMPKDIMILVRQRRGDLAYNIIQQCKLANIPVGGMDRLVLNDDIAVQDLIAAAKFALSPHDELNLACLLKSPLIGLSEDQLFQLCYKREENLWKILLSSEFEDISAYLEALRQTRSDSHVHGFFSTILNIPCPADEKSGLRAVQTRLGHACLDPIDEFLNLALQKQKTMDLCAFIHWFAREPITIKREQSGEENVVRLMTVHGAKGLQAPIVILPDTISTPETSSKHVPKRLLWPDKTNLDVPLFSPRTDDDPNVYTQAMQSVKDLELAEYSRLLYVALTRAEDHLYIGGVDKGKDPSPHTWYMQIKSALSTMEQCQMLEDGTVELYTPPSRDGDRIDEQNNIAHVNVALPSWAFTPMTAEPHSKNIKTLERQTFRNNKFDTPALHRGRLIHKLLEILPHAPHKMRENLGAQYTKTNIPNLSEAETRELLDKVLQIFENDELAIFFGPHARAEVPITVKDEHGNITNNIIDRLVVNTDTVWILDYKTDQNPPNNPSEIPNAYIDQLARYKDAVALIYPSHNIRCAILWTETLKLMECYL